MPLLTTLVDNFNDGAIAGNWGNAYGGVSEVGGRARVPCTTGYAGYQTAYSWTMAGASWYVAVLATPAVSGATEAYCAAVVNAPDVSTSGLRVGFIINVVTGQLRCISDTAYYDAAATVLTYSATTHKFLRLREDGTNVYWDTSTDGSTWTNRRTLATPAWISAATEQCALDLSSHRSSGTADYAEFDNFNTLSDGTVYPLSATLAADSTVTAAASVVAALSAALTAESALTADTVITTYLAATLHASSALTADTAGQDTADVDLRIGRPTSRWAVSAPWR